MIKNDTVILKATNVSLFSWVIIDSFLAFFIVSFIIVKFIILSIILIVGFIILNYYIVKIKKNIFFYNSYFEQKSFRSGQLLIKCNYDEIEKINIWIYVDTKKSGKMLNVFLKNKSQYKIKLEMVYFEDIARIFLNSNVKLFILNNNSFIEYQNKNYYKY
jgi:hypothetical protein